MAIKNIIDLKPTYTKEDIAAIKKLLSDIDLSGHYDGSQWLDYKMHLNYFLKQHGVEKDIL